MNERIRELRKALRLSQEEFGSRLGITGSGVSNLESGRRSITEQMLKSLLREYKVDYIWLTTGKGEMFLRDKSELLDSLRVIMADESDIRKPIIEKLVHADKDELEHLEKWICFCSGIKREGG